MENLTSREYNENIAVNYLNRTLQKFQWFNLKPMKAFRRAWIQLRSGSVQVGVNVCRECMFYVQMGRNHFIYRVQKLALMARSCSGPLCNFDFFFRSFKIIHAFFKQSFKCIFKKRHFSKWIKSLCLLRKHIL